MSLPMKSGARAIGDEVTSPAGQVNRARGIVTAAVRRCSHSYCFFAGLGVAMGGKDFT
jgi:hypothetical protein